MFVSGHTNGATLATLAAMKTTPFAASAPISAVVDVRDIVRWDEPALFIFDMNDLSEVNIRSPMMYASSIRVPIRMFVGSQDSSFEATQKMVESAEYFKKPCEIVQTIGDHNSSKPEAIRGAIECFQSLCR